jgi:hypothetical protein
MVGYLWLARWRCLNPGWFQGLREAYKRLMRLNIFLAAVFVATAGGARAGVIYSNFGPGDSYHIDSGVPIDQTPSISFISTTDQVLSEVDFAVYLRSAGSANALTVRLSEGTAGHPGASLGTDTFDGSLSVTSAIYQWIPSTQLALTGGAQYWISLESAPGNVIWSYNDQLTAGDSRFISNTWTAQPADTQGVIRIMGAQADAAAAPEPGTWAMLTGGLAAFAEIRRRRRN